MRIYRSPYLEIVLGLVIYQMATLDRIADTINWSKMGIELRIDAIHLDFVIRTVCKRRQEVLNINVHNHIKK